MINMDKVNQFFRVLKNAESDVELQMKKVDTLCDYAIDEKMSFQEMISKYELEKNMSNKDGMMEGLQTLAKYLLDDLNSLSDELNKLDEIFKDIEDGRINVPNYVDEREIIASKFKGVLDEFKYAFSDLIVNLQAFVEQPNKSNLEVVNNSVDIEMEIDELNSKVKEVSDEMLDELNEIHTKIDNYVKANTYTR